MQLRDPAQDGPEQMAGPTRSSPPRRSSLLVTPKPTFSHFPYSPNALHPKPLSVVDFLLPLKIPVDVSPSLASATGCCVLPRQASLQDALWWGPYYYQPFPPRCSCRYQPSHLSPAALLSCEKIKKRLYSAHFSVVTKAWRSQLPAVTLLSQ